MASPMSRVNSLVSADIGNYLTNKETWKDIIFNVKDYGAKGDGTTDDTVDIQETVQAASAVGGGIVYFPPGTFLATNISISSLSNITFDGSGEIKSKDGTNSNGLILIDTCQNITIRNIKITGKGGLGSGSNDDGITVKKTKNIRITGCFISNFSRNSISLFGQTVYDDNFKYPSMIDNNTIRDSYIGVLINSDAEYYDIDMNKIINNTFGLYGGFGNINVRNNQISYNITGMQLDGALHSNGDHNSISGNKMNHNRAVGLRIINNDSRISIVDNQIVSTVGPETFGSSGVSYSLILETVKNLQFIGNQIDGGSAQIMSISAQTQCHYIGNVFFSGNLQEFSAGSQNYFIGNTYINSSIVLHASSIETIRSYDNSNGVFIGTPAETINKIAATLLGTWTNTGSPFEDLYYWKDGEGAVHIQGTVSGGAVFDNIMTLPTNYRPRRNMDRPTTTGDAGLHGSIRIYSNGNVQLTSGATTQVHVQAYFKL